MCQNNLNSDAKIAHSHTHKSSKLKLFAQIIFVPKKFTFYPRFHGKIVQISFRTDENSLLRNTITIQRKLFTFFPY